VSDELERLRAENERLRAELETQRAEFAASRQLIANVMDAEDEGRRRIAQLIHDDALQSLLAAHQELIEAAPGRAQVQRAHEVVGGAIARLRSALVSLHPVTLEEGGFEQALGAVARQVERQGGFVVDVTVDQAALGIQDELLLAIVRELLTNAARHSGATRVQVEVRRANERVEIEVRDDGRGLSPGRLGRALAEGHIGLASVRERIGSAGGDFELSSSGEGTHARAWIPVA
jgi:two-component system NarL family sensor kinase